MKDKKNLLMLALLLALMGHQLYFGRITATAEQDALYYNDTVYQEVFEEIDIETDSCLGSVSYGEDQSHRFYSLKDRPQYVVVDLGWEQKLYKTEGLVSG